MSTTEMTPFFSPVGELLKALSTFPRQPPYSDPRALHTVAKFLSHRTKALQYLTGLGHPPPVRYNQPLSVLQDIDTFRLNNPVYSIAIVDALDALDLVKPYPHIIISRLLDAGSYAKLAVSEVLRRSNGLASCSEEHKQLLLARAVEQGCPHIAQLLLDQGIDVTGLVPGTQTTHFKALVVRVAEHQRLNPVPSNEAVEGFMSIAWSLASHGAPVERDHYKAYELPKAFENTMEALQELYGVASAVEEISRRKRGREEEVPGDTKQAAKRR